MKRRDFQVTRQVKQVPAEVRFLKLMGYLLVATLALSAGVLAAIVGV
jgi:hypothetical protein